LREQPRNKKKDMKMTRVLYWLVVCVIVPTGLSACGGGGGSPTTNATVDGITITNISPASAVAGTNTTFSVDVSYSLASKSSGVLMVGFNTSSVNGYSMISSQEFVVAQGSGTHTFTATAIPADWGATGTFGAYVNISENPHPVPWTPLAGDTKTIPLSSTASAVVAISAIAYKSDTNPRQCNQDICF
jgi:hypothetical protein